MSKKNRRKEQLIAWIAVLIIAAAVIAGLVFLFIKVKDPVKGYIKGSWNTLLNGQQVKEPIEEEPEEETVSQDEALQEGVALDESALDAIFTDEEEDAEPEEEEPKEEDELYNECLDQAEDIVESMTLRQKAAQLFFITPEALTGVDVATAAGEKTRLSYEEYPVGGIIFFKQNLESPEQLTQMTANLKKYSEESVGVPVLLGIDEEGGSVTRIAGTEGFEVESVPTMTEIGSSMEYEQAYNAGHTIGAYLSEYGFDLNMAPDADVIAEGDENAIGDRSFGSDETIVGNMAVSYLEGLHASGVLGVAKHFPGHGCVTGDTHDGMAVTDLDWDELEDYYLKPFEKLIDNKIKFLMVSHVCVPEVAGDEIPASMSGIIMSEKLRLKMGYNGIIITDAMNMGAVANEFDSASAAVEAVKAGADMVLMPEDFMESYEGILSAVENGTISEERISDSVEKIVGIKLYLQKYHEMMAEAENQ